MGRDCEGLSHLESDRGQSTFVQVMPETFILPIKIETVACLAGQFDFANTGICGCLFMVSTSRSDPGPIFDYAELWPTECSLSSQHAEKSAVAVVLLGS